MCGCCGGDGSGLFWRWGGKSGWGLVYEFPRSHHTGCSDAPSKAVIAVLSRRLGFREVREMGRGYVSYGTVSSAPVFILDTSGHWREFNISRVPTSSRESRAEARGLRDLLE